MLTALIQPVPNQYQQILVTTCYISTPLLLHRTDGRHLDMSDAEDSVKAFLTSSHLALHDKATLDKLRSSHLEGIYGALGGIIGRVPYQHHTLLVFE